MMSRLARWWADRMRVEEATTPEAREAIYRLRYQVLARECGKHYIQTIDHAGERIHDSEDDWPEARHYFIRDGGRVVAAMRQIVASERIRHMPILAPYNLDRFAQFPIASCGLSSRLAALPSWRGTVRTVALFRHAYRSVRAEHPRMLFSFSQAKIGVFVHYTRFGYRQCGPGFQVAHGGGLNLPIVMILGDAEYLRSLRSIFADLSQATQSSDDAAAVALWYQTLAPQLLEGTTEARELFSHMPMAAGLTPQDIQELLARGCTLTLQPGETLISEGALESDIYVLLRGELQVRTPQTGAAVIRSLFAGDILGEVAHCAQLGERTATVQAATPSMVLAIREGSLKRWRTERPELAMKLYQQFAQAMAKRSTGPSGKI